MKKKNIVATVFGLALMFGAMGAANASPAVAKNAPNFRTSPDTDSGTMGHIPTGTNVDAEKINSWWSKVTYDGKTGYVSNGYLTYGASVPETNPTPEPTATPEPTTTPETTPAPTTSTPVPTPASTTSRSALIDRIIARGEKYFGTPYRYGASAGSGYFDCSLFVQTVFKENGISLLRSSRQQATQGTYVPISQLQRGDLVIFKKDGRIYHVAIYAGNGKILHTYGAGGVRYSDLNYGSWKANAAFGRRVIK